MTAKYSQEREEHGTVVARQGDCPLHFSPSVLSSKRNALDLMYSQFSKLRPLPESIRAYACTCICAALHRIPKGGTVLCFQH